MANKEILSEKEYKLHCPDEIQWVDIYNKVIKKRQKKLIWRGLFEQIYIGELYICKLLLKCDKISVNRFFFSHYKVFLIYIQDTS